MASASDGRCQLAAFGYAFALIVYALLTVLLLNGWRRRDHSLSPELATGISSETPHFA
jgi:hypothetical protein